MSTDNGPSTTVTIKGMELKLTMLLGGLRAHAPKNTPVLVGSVTFPSADDLIKKLELYLAPYATARELRRQVRNAVAARRAIHKEVSEFVKDTKIFAAGLLGRKNAKLEEFGFKAEQDPAPLTVEEKALRAAKARATRALRGTKGKRQKEAIKAEVDRIVIERGGSAPNDSAPSSTNGSDNRVSP